MAAVKTKKETVKAQPAPEVFDIRDLIGQEDWVANTSLHEWLGVNPNQIRAPEALRYFTTYKPAGGNDQLHKGSAILAWIAGENIQFELTDRGREMLAIRQRISDREVAEKKRQEQGPALPGGLIGNALKLKVESARQRELEEAKRHTEGMRAYLQILNRDVQDKTTRTDSEKLVELIDLLGLDVGTLRADRDVVERALELMGRHDKLEAASEALSKARAKVEAVRSEFQDALDAVECEFSHASAQHHEASAAGRSLIELCRKRPEFFDDSHPPILRNSKRG